MNYYIDFDHTLFDTQKLVENQKIENCSEYIFTDSIPFLKKLKKAGHKLYMLSYGGNVLKLIIKMEFLLTIILEI